MSVRTRNYLLGRVLMLVPLLLGLTVVIFTMIHLAPGDPALAFISEQANDPVMLAQIRQNLGLDQPLPVQYWLWVQQVARLDFGTAYTFNRKPVVALIGERLMPTIELQTLALIVSLVVAIPIGIISAKKQYSLTDNVTTVGAFLGLALPNFWVALMLQLGLGVMLGWLPVSTPGNDAVGLERLKFFIMPTLVLAFPLVAVFARFMRSSMLEVLHQDYVRTATAKGLSDWIVTARHALKNALVPMVTVVGTQVPRLLSGAIIVEYIFAWPGLGSLAYESILRRDYPVIMALTLLTGAAVLVVNLLVDVMYVFLDPRIAFD